MRRIRPLLSVVLAAAAAVAFAQPASAAPGPYVALGDSYAAGSGAGDYYTDGCQLSKNSYPYLWAEANSPSSFTFAACGGAQTADVLANQVQRLTADTKVVTVTIGGNDTGWGDILKSCVLSSDAACATLNEQARTFIRDTLPGRLNSVYAAISDRAPNADVVVVGYPHLFGDSTCLLVSSGKRTEFNKTADQLSTTISARAAAYGFHYVDARTSFATHEVCGSGTDWIKSISDDGSFHPNATGQRYGYYEPLESVI